MQDPKDYSPVDWTKLDYFIAGLTLGWVFHLVFDYFIYEVLRL